jgi:oligopeptide transport system ATP-binding protein
MATDGYLIEVKNLKMYFPVLAGVFRRRVADIKAVDDVSFSIRRGETMGLVGESGCGKTTTGRCVIRLEKPSAGVINFEGVDLMKLSPNALRKARRNMQLIYQDPFGSFDPRQTAGDTVGEPLKIHNIAKGKEYDDRVNEIFRLVELEPRMKFRYPHEFSGGQRQRLGIARALSVEPRFIVCDEPVSALDVSIQAQIIRLLEKLKDNLKLTYLFIAHDLSVVRYISDRVAVMYLGKIMEITTSDELYKNPLHPYTQALLSAVPIPDPVVDRQRKRILLSGDVPSPVNPPKGCHFNPRCRLMQNICKEQEPPLVNIGGDHWVACHLVK